MYTLLIAVIYLAFISLGLPDSLLGAAWPTMYPSLDVPISYMGFISMIIFAGTVTSSLLSDRLTAKFGARVVTSLSVLLTALSLYGFSVAENFYTLCLLAVPYGLGAGAIDAALNNYVALHYNSRHLNWLHCFWGVGAIISPYIMSYALTHSVWQNGYRIVSYLQFGIFVVLLIALPLWKINTARVEERAEVARPTASSSVLKIKGVPHLLLAFFAYCAAEASSMLWASSYLETHIGLTKDEAAAYGALFFIGITVGRFLVGFISERVGDRRLMYLGSAIAILGTVFILIPKKIPAVIGFVVIGFGCSPIYAAIIHSTPRNFGAENSSAIIGIQMASAYTGSLIAPPLFGLIADFISIRILPIYLCLFFILMVVMIRKTEKEVSP